MKSIIEFLSENNWVSPIESLVKNGYTPADIDEAVDSGLVKIEGYNAILIEMPVKEKKPIKKLVPKKPAKSKKIEEQPEAIPEPETIEKPEPEPEELKEEKAPENVSKVRQSTFEKYSFERLHKLEERMKKAKFSDQKKLERIWGKYMLKLRGWVNSESEGHTKQSWLDYCEKNNLEPNYLAAPLFQK